MEWAPAVPSRRHRTTTLRIQQPCRMQSRPSPRSVPKTRNQFHARCGKTSGGHPNPSRIRPSSDGTYEPVLLKLEPTPNNFRLVGATEAKQDALQGSTADWGMYSSFVEERLPAQATKAAVGRLPVTGSFGTRAWRVRHSAAPHQ